MEDLVACSENITAYSAAGAVTIVMFITLVVFCFRRTITSLLYGVLISALSYGAVWYFMPTLVIFFVFGTLGIGAAACENF